MTARPMEGPWYTADEALQKLGILKSELEYAIKKNRITGVVRLTAQPLLLFTPSSEGWTGHATAKYYGHLALSGGLIGALLQGKKFELRDGFGQVMELDELHGWSSANPFGVEGLLEPLTDWQPHDYAQHPISTYCAAFLPSARESIMKDFVGLAEKIDKANGTGFGSSLREDQELFDGPDWDQTKLYFDRSTIKPSQLRFAASELSNFGLGTNRQTISDLNHPKIDETSLAQFKDWDQVCIRLIAAHQTKSARDLWRVLTEDCKLRERAFDKDNIIINISKQRLHYETEYSSAVKFEFDSFSGKISRLRKHAKKISVQK